MKCRRLKKVARVVLFSVDMILLIVTIGLPICMQAPVAGRVCLPQPQTLRFAVDDSDDSVAVLSRLERIRVYYSLSDRKLSGCVEIGAKALTCARQECELPKGTFGFRLDFVYRPNGPALGVPLPLKELSLGDKDLLADAPLTRVDLPAMRSVGWMYEPEVFIGGHVWNLVLCGAAIYLVSLFFFLMFIRRERGDNA